MIALDFTNRILSRSAKTDSYKLGGGLVYISANIDQMLLSAVWCKGRSRQVGNTTVNPHVSDYFKCNKFWKKERVSCNGQADVSLIAAPLWV